MVEVSSYICACCGQRSESPWCDYCGFPAGTGSDAAADRQRAAEYRAGLVAELSSLELTGPRYSRNGEFSAVSAASPLCASGSECLGRYAWSKDWIAHPPQGRAEGVLSIRYRFRGHTRTVGAAVVLPPWEGEARVGVCLLPSLRLTVAVGKPPADGAAMSDVVQLIACADALPLDLTD